MEMLMPDDRLRYDGDDIEQLDDLIEARDDGTSHFARDIDAADTDIDIPKDIDVDEALTFPHPKRKKNPNEDIDLMDTPRKDDIDIDWAESQGDMLPSDYEDDYDDALTTNLDDEDTVAEDQMSEISRMDADDLIDETPMVTGLPKGFRAEEEVSEEASSPPRRYEQQQVEMESAMETGTDEDAISIEERFGGEMKPEDARRALQQTEPEQTEE
jgi:hypothetical protein